MSCGLRYGGLLYEMISYHFVLAGLGRNIKLVAVRVLHAGPPRHLETPED